jgi:uncharacterized protein YkwD
MKTVAITSVCLFVLSACAPSPAPKRIGVNRNAALRCEPDDQVRKKMLRLVNRARSSQRRCGAKVYPPVASIRWNAALARAAQRHAVDMARYNRLSHTGSSGSTPAARVNKAGYRWRAVGENIAAGQPTCEAVVDNWLASAGHCANLMETRFTEMGAACEQVSSTKYGTYWTLVLATPVQ